MLISIFLLFCSVVQRSITVSPTKKVKAAHPHTQQGDFQPHGALKSDSKHKTQRLGKDKGVISSILSTTFSITKTLSPLSSASVKKYGFLPAAYSRMCFDSGFSNC